MCLLSTLGIDKLSLYHILVSEQLTGELQALGEEMQSEKTLRAQAEKDAQEVRWKGGLR